MAQHRTQRDESTHGDDHPGTRRKRQKQRREADIEREVGGPHEGWGLEQFRHPALLAAGGLAAYAGLKRFGKLSSLFWMGLGGGLIYRVLDENELLGDRLKQRLLQTAASGTTHLHMAITIDQSVEEVYRGWRDLENLAESMRHLESVEPIDGDRTRWRFRAHVPKVDMNIEWETEIVEDRENEHLAWRSTDESDIHNEGIVEFRPRRGGDSTEIHIHLLYHPPGGNIGQQLGQFLRGLSEQTLKADVRRFKQYLEAGVVATIDGQPSGRDENQIRRIQRRSRPTVH